MASRGWFLLGGLLVGCHTTPTARVEETRPEPPVMQPAAQAKVAPPAVRAREQAWEGTIRLTHEEAVPRGKVFRGAWLEAADGTRRVLTYESDSPFHALCDQPVSVTGEIYTPDGQALVAEHLRSRGLRVTAVDAPLRAIGEKRTMRGHFEVARPDEQTARFIEEGGVSHLVRHVSWQASEPVPRCSRGAPLRAPKPVPASQPVEVEVYPVSTDDTLADDAPLWVMSWKHVAT